MSVSHKSLHVQLLYFKWESVPITMKEPCWWWDGLDTTLCDKVCQWLI